MEIILKQDIKGLGYKNDLVQVKPGYARNYLIPQGFAVIANGTNKKILSENIRQAAHKAEKLKTEATELATKINNLVVSIATKVGESGKIFGAITSLQIADALKAKGIEIDRKKIDFKESIKEVGEYTVTIDLHREIKADLKVTIVAE